MSSKDMSCPQKVWKVPHDIQKSIESTSVQCLSGHQE